MKEPRTCFAMVNQQFTSLAALPEGEGIGVQRG